MTQMTQTYTIPEDLRALYERAGRHVGPAASMDFAIFPQILCTIIERLAKAERAVGELRALVESYRHEHSMSCAVWTPGPVDNRCWICKRVDALLAAERYLAPEQAEQKGERKG